MKRLLFHLSITGIILCIGMLFPCCTQKAEHVNKGMGTSKVNFDALNQSQNKQKNLKREYASNTAEPESKDFLHADMLHYPIERGWLETDTICHYPTGKKIQVGVHLGEKLYLELGDFYDDMVYDGAKVYWGDSLIYATDQSIANDWQTCHVHHVKNSDHTYLLLLIDDHPNPNYWHILSMNATDINLIDYILAGNDYVEGAHYFHDNIVYNDLDNDGVIEVGGKFWTELFEDSMTYQPCYYYKLDKELTFDSITSEAETRKAYYGIFKGFKNGLHIYNPNKEQHEKGEE